MQAPQLSTLTIVRASTLRALRIRSPTLRTLRLDDLSMLEALDVEAPLLDSLELEKGARSHIPKTKCRSINLLLASSSLYHFLYKYTTTTKQPRNSTPSASKATPSTS